jgi:ElaB/YqjD/DUF883 family membrane-anchored ribosome-binding protein
MNATTDNRSPADLEREGDEIRADLDRTLDEIQRRFNPAELMDRSMEYFRENGSELLREAGDTIRRNPVPLLLTAAGLVWLTASVAKSRSSSSYASESGSASQFAGRASRSYTGSDDYGSEYESGDGSTSDRLRGRVRKAAQSVKGKLSSSVQNLQSQTYGARSHFSTLVQEQPVALGALALAAGALLGAALPVTESENRWVGPVHDRTMARAKEVGKREYENIRQAVTSSAERRRSSSGVREEGGNGSQQPSQS